MLKTDRSPLWRPERQGRRVAPLAALALALSLSLGSLSARADGPRGHEDSAALRARAQALAKLDADRPAELFFALEAEAFLWSADHEEARNDASGYARSARAQAELAIDRLERRRLPHPHPLTEAQPATGAELVGAEPSNEPAAVPVAQWQGAAMRALAEGKARSDIEQELDGILASPALRCSAPELARAYGFLAHARNALDDLGWRYADPYFRLAELRLGQAKKLAATCAAPAPESKP